MLNLILALLWFAVAIFLYWRDVGGDKTLPVSAIALILGVYNLVRWGFTLSRSQKAQGEQLLPRRRLHRASDDLPAPDPNFVFTDPPPPQPQAPAPPGTNGKGPENNGTGFSS